MNALPRSLRLYVRCSTDEQAQSALGIEAQTAALEAAVRARGWSAVPCRTYVDAGASGANVDRPQYQRMLNATRRGDVILCSRIDRISRSVADFAGLLDTARRRRWTLVCLDPDLDMTTPNGELVAHLLIAVSQWERRIIAQRTTEALAAKRARGEYVGHAILIPRELEDTILGWRRHERLTQQQITDRLNEQGIPRPSGDGKPWNKSTVQALLARVRREELTTQTDRTPPRR